MQIEELDSYNLSDAVRFHDELNPALWDGMRMRPEVRDALLKIAHDFREFMGINDLALKDITVSGSNAAFSYTPHSDIDLHLVVDMEQLDPDEVYRELFNAKKYQYNDQHNIKVRGYDVELYVQDASLPVKSLGEYSLINDDWTHIPIRRRANLDDGITKRKYEKLGHLIELALHSNNLEMVEIVKNIIKKYRQAGLDEHGEFGPENLAFKILRSQGAIQKLFDHLNALKDQELSLVEKAPAQPVVYGYTTPNIEESPDGVNPTTTQVLNEKEPKGMQEIIQDFVDYCVDRLKIERSPNLKLRHDPEWSKRNHTFGIYTAEDNILRVGVANRHIMDILRTVAHELTHQRQHEVTDVPPDAGNTGSDHENVANAMAGILMRDYSKMHPEHFIDAPLDEETFGASTLGAMEEDTQLQEVGDFPKVEQRLVDLGYERIGIGADKTVWAKEKGPVILILMPEMIVDSAAATALSLMKLSLSQPNNPFLPKYIPMKDPKTGEVSRVSEFTVDGNRFYQIAMERLQPFEGLTQKLWGYIIDEMQRSSNFEEFIKEVRDTPSRQRPRVVVQYVQDSKNLLKLKLLFETLNTLKSIASKSRYGLELKPANIMQRDDGTPVFIDPWYTWILRGGESPAKLYKQVYAKESETLEQINERYILGLAFGESASGYIPTRRQAKDPRFKMALTTDIKPGEVGRQANKLALNVDSQGHTDLLDKNLQNLLREFQEFKRLDEVEMSPGSLEAWAKSPEAQGVVAGFEAEVAFPDIGQGSEGPEPDYDEDRSAEDIEDIVSFFDDSDYNSSRDIRRLRDELQDNFRDYVYEEIETRWNSDEGSEFLKNYFEFNETEAIRDYLSDQGLNDKEITKIINDPDSKAYQTAYSNSYETQLDKIRDQAQEAFEEDFRSNTDMSELERDFLRNEGIYSMSDVENQYSVSWPYFSEAEEEGAPRFEETTKLARKLSQVVGQEVIPGQAYHSVTRSSNSYNIEPDPSISAESGDAGLEIVSPPQPLSKTLEDFDKVLNFVKRQGGYTNSSTGLHMNISVPNMQNLDYTKLVLFVGDQYVLEEFKRSSNQYARSVLANIKQRIQNYDAQTLSQAFANMKGSFDQVAKKLIGHDFGLNKYASVHLRNGWVEFRSPGNDYLEMGTKKLVATMLRFARALVIACDPNLHKEEYGKKLYKLLTKFGTGRTDELDAFVSYSSNQLTKQDLKSLLQYRVYKRKQAQDTQKFNWLIVNNLDKTIAGEFQATQSEAPATFDKWLMDNNMLGFRHRFVYKMDTNPQSQPAAQPTAQPAATGHLPGNVQPPQIAEAVLPGFKVYTAKVKVKTQNWTTSTDITVFAKDIQMARSLINQQYGKASVVSQVREIK